MAPTISCKEKRMEKRKKEKKKEEAKRQTERGGGGEPGARARANDIPETCSRRGAACVLGLGRDKREEEKGEIVCVESLIFFLFLLLVLLGRKRERERMVS